MHIAALPIAAFKEKPKVKSFNCTFLLCTLLLCPLLLCPLLLCPLLLCKLLLCILLLCTLLLCPLLLSKKQDIKAHGWQPTKCRHRTVHRKGLISMDAAGQKCYWNTYRMLRVRKPVSRSTSEWNKGCAYASGTFISLPAIARFE